MLRTGKRAQEQHQHDKQNELKALVPQYDGTLKFSGVSLLGYIPFAESHEFKATLNTWHDAFLFAP